MVIYSNTADQLCTPQKLCYIVPVRRNMTLAALPLVHNMQLHSILRPPLKIMEDRSVDHHPQGVHDAGPHHQNEVVLCRSKAACQQQFSVHAWTKMAGKYIFECIGTVAAHWWATDAKADRDAACCISATAKSAALLLKVISFQNLHCITLS